MAYKRAIDLLPENLIKAIQNYIDGEYIYIPRRDCNRKKWGDTTATRQDLFVRNIELYMKYQSGVSVKELENIYYLSGKTIYKIIADIKTNNY
ncbi:MAG TPA: CD3324 family protein [Bacillota bacterium]|nr:CD3324 family protein [Bacillota bacterium]